MVKQIFDHEFSTGKIFTEFKRFTFNGAFIYRTYWILIVVKFDPGLVVYVQFEKKNASEEFMKRYEEIQSVQQIKWLQKKT